MPEHCCTALTTANQSITPGSHHRSDRLAIADICPIVPAAALLFLTLNPACAQERTSRFDIEAGVITTQNMEIHGYNQGNATAGWKKSGADVRVEYWNTKQNDWNYGVVFQPLNLNYSGVLTNNLNYQGQVFHAGDPATLSYQFPTLRFTANYPIFESGAGDSYLRTGGSLIVRYARIGLSSPTSSFVSINLIALPTFNIEASKAIGNGYSLFTRSDFLPSIDGNVFLDGLFDIFAGIRKSLGDGKSLDAGLRMFFGGYNPNTPDDYANRIFFNSFVVRYSS